jgi:hypothetical protein
VFPGSTLNPCLVGILYQAGVGIGCTGCGMPNCLASKNIVLATSLLGLYFDFAKKRVQVLLGSRMYLDRFVVSHRLRIFGCSKYRSLFYVLGVGSET